MKTKRKCVVDDGRSIELASLESQIEKKTLKYLIAKELLKKTYALKS